MAVRRLSRQRRDLPAGAVAQLLFGWDYFGDAWGDGPQAVGAMREAWKRPEVQEKVLAEWQARRARCPDEPAPWARRAFGDSGRELNCLCDGPCGPCPKCPARPLFGN
jgi:hypothetical protein